MDGVFILRNYFDRNPESEGANFHQCLYSPQIDVCTFLKHYRETDIPVLTFPLSLQALQKGGFPYIMAFRDGKMIHQGFLSNYDTVFNKLSSVLWPSEERPMIQTSPLHMATLNCMSSILYVVPDNDRETYAHHEQYAKRDRLIELGLSVTVKYEQELTTDDLRKNLVLDGSTERFSFDLFKGQDIPVSIDPDFIRMGPYKFPVHDTGLHTFFPNPRNPEAFVKLSLKGKELSLAHYENWVDYVVTCSTGPESSPEIVMHGFFEKSEPSSWRFSESLAYDTMGERYREDASSLHHEQKVHCPMHERRVVVSPPLETDQGLMFTLGAGTCRFPDITVDQAGICWAVWEEEGDIVLAPMQPRAKEFPGLAVESNASDSFNPKIVPLGESLWVFYLNDQDGFYRLYGKRFDGQGLTDPMTVSDIGPFDVVTPAAAAHANGSVSLVWTEWKANQRFLKHCLLENGRKKPSQTVAIAQDKEVPGYFNAWCPSAAFDREGNAWGAWNQHYPANMSVCAGRLAGQAEQVSLPYQGDASHENGGYPCLVFDPENRPWVFWESFAWDLIMRRADKQAIRGAVFDPGREEWIATGDISQGSGTVLNQTPCAAVKSDGSIWLAWSGRKGTNDLDSSWSIYLCSLENGRWTEPMRISRQGINSRAPVMASGKEGDLWIAWQAGRGRDMRIEVLRFRDQ